MYIYLKPYYRIDRKNESYKRTKHFQTSYKQSKCNEQQTELRREDTKTVRSKEEWERAGDCERERELDRARISFGTRAKWIKNKARCVFTTMRNPCPARLISHQINSKLLFEYHLTIFEHLRTSTCAPHSMTQRPPAVRQSVTLAGQKPFRQTLRRRLLGR